VSEVDRDTGPEFNPEPEREAEPQPAVPSESVEPTPRILTVDVKRHASPPESPFRSTADVAVAQATIEDAVPVPQAHFLGSSDALYEMVGHRPGDFFAQVAPRLGLEADPYLADRPSPAAAAEAAPRRREQLNDRVVEKMTARYSAVYDPRRRDRHLTQAVIAALVVGAVVGFGLGLVASKWLL
jgi:hypothetical protein